jgi:nitrous oxide reductase accessory protein NosL
MKKILFILAATVALAGCQDEEKALYAAPVIRPVGTFEGCVVKFVDRGWKSESFYIAACDVASVVSWNVQMGKTTQTRQSITVTKQVEAEKAALAVKESAINKLTPDERKALGLE